MRRRDRQMANIAVLVARVAEVQALLVAIPGAALRIGQGSKTVKDALAAISSLRHGAWPRCWARARRPSRLLAATACC